MTDRMNWTRLFNRSAKRLIAWFVAGYVGLIILDLVLYEFGKHVWSVPVAVWGTYAAWASAIMPAATIFFTAVFWLADRDRRDQERLDGELFRVRLEERAEGVWMVNDSSYAVALESYTADGADILRAEWVPVRESVFIGRSAKVERVRVTVLHHTCELTVGRPGQRLD